MFSSWCYAWTKKIGVTIEVTMDFDMVNKTLHMANTMHKISAEVSELPGIVCDLTKGVTAGQRWRLESQYLIFKRQETSKKGTLNPKLLSAIIPSCSSPCME
ncbi:hypothetical protein AAFF_G00176570 [Aldrovandia affinis]|uniref:Uncharacterized protein n=1 Tax=Aldrovandia affinis TaxID=143900 RepID=A0AAD7RKZ7_9TELE|nr:hypothetical protein AAFF_G00176570 [Aldrovandia affinis]